jgi:hypothetical protein
MKERVPRISLKRVNSRKLGLHHKELYKIKEQWQQAKKEVQEVKVEIKTLRDLMYQTLLPAN